MNKIVIKLSIMSMFAITISAGAQVNNTSGFDSSGKLTTKTVDYNKSDRSLAGKGFDIPKVSLSSVDNLYPLFESDGKGGYVNAKKAVEDHKHIGLIVFNKTGKEATNKTQFPEGLYMWDGKRWETLSGGTATAVATTDTKETKETPKESKEE